MKKNLDNIKVAVFYDWLNQWGGAEKVLVDILKIYPKADIHTLVYNPKKTNWLPKKHNIFPSLINNLPFSKSNSIIYTPAYAHILERIDFSKYDLLISTTSTVGHCFNTKKNTLFICYMHNINRYLYNTPKQFKFLEPLLKIYKKIDYNFGQKPDYIFCNSKTVKDRIKKIYKREATIIHPGVDTKFFVPAKKETDSEYYLLVSRLVRHKRIDIAINAANILNKKLYIIGEGRDKKYFQKISKNNKNILFLGSTTKENLLKYYQNCKALICPQEEDFGISPLEANSCGIPVIAYKKGGIKETSIINKTSMLFKKQTVDSLIIAIKKFEKMKFEKNICRQNALNYSEDKFVINFKNEVNKLWIKK